MNPNVVAISGDVKNSTFSEIFGDAYPDQFYPGLHRRAEYGERGSGHGGAGQRAPFVDTFACFLSRAFDQVRMAAISRSNHQSVRIALRRFHRRRWAVANGARGSGLVPRGSRLGGVLSRDAVSTERLTEETARRPGICYMRTSRPKTPVLYTAKEEFPVPGFKVLRQSAQDRVTVIGAGVTLYEALKAYDQLEAQGIAIRVIDLYCVKPMDGAALAENVRATGGASGDRRRPLSARADWAKRC